MSLRNLLSSRVQVAAALAAGAGTLSIYDESDQSRALINLVIPSAMGEATSVAPQPEPLARLKAWLGEQGADISHIDFRASKVGQDSGVGIYIADGQKPMQSRRRRWWAPWASAPTYAVAADFPLSLAITADNILHDAHVGSQYGWLLERGVLDDRQIVQCHLAVERARGQGSPLYPWMAVLPQEFHSPLCWNDSELVELRGTTLMRATLTMRSHMADRWQRLRTALTEVASKLGAPRAPTYEDMMWAHCVFWSRGQSLPVPKHAGAASQLVAAAARGKAPQGQLITVHEGIVPGLDFANHQGRAAGCWWEVVQAQGAEGKAAAKTAAPASSALAPAGEPERPLATAHIRLQLYPGWQARAGDELTINYGDGKSNEELLLLHGFVSEEGTAADMVMVACPVPPSAQWDEVMTARMELLTSSGMRPQFFLRQGSGQDAPPVPLEVLEALEVFTLSPAEVGQRLDALHAQQAARQQGHRDAVMAECLSGAELDLDVVSKRLKQRPAEADLNQLALQLGLRMAAVTTYVRLLELRLVEMESRDQGTCSLEADEQMLAAHAAALAQQQQQQAATGSTTAGGSTIAPAGGLLPYRQWCAVVYRAGQKRVVRSHLVGARHELQAIMDLLAIIQEMQR